MANVSFTINGDNYEAAQSVTCYVGDSLSINYTRVKTTSATYYYAILVDGTEEVAGCYYDSSFTTYSDYIHTNLVGSPTTAGTYKLKMGKFIVSSHRIVEGEYITLTVKPLAYYSNLKYDANTGIGAPSEDRYSIATDTKPTDRNAIIPNTTPTLTDYVFQGWSKTKYPINPSIIGVADYKAGDTIQVPYLDTDTTSITLYAVWKAAPTPQPETYTSIYIGDTKVRIYNEEKNIKIK